MTSIEVPYSIAAALPTLSVMDVTNDVAQTLTRSGKQDGIAYIHASHGRSLVRIQERETGFFEDLEGLLERIVPSDVKSEAGASASSLRCSHRGASRCRSAAAGSASAGSSASCCSRSTRSTGTTGL
jgi:hypothetical protein